MLLPSSVQATTGTSSTLQLTGSAKLQQSRPMDYDYDYELDSNLNLVRGEGMGAEKGAVSGIPRRPRPPLNRVSLAFVHSKNGFWKIPSCRPSHPYPNQSPTNQ